jgi:hypothetical protein
MDAPGRPRRLIVPAVFQRASMECTSAKHKPVAKAKAEAKAKAVAKAKAEAQAKAEAKANVNAGVIRGMAGDVAARFKETGLARVLSGAACSGLHVLLSGLMLLVGFCSRDFASLAVTTAAAGTILLLNALLHTCPLTAMEEERWGVSNTRGWMRWSEAFLGAAPGDAYAVQMQYIVIASALLLVRLLLMALRRSGADVVRLLDALL